METTLRNPFTRLGVASREAWVVPALIAVLNLLSAGGVSAQTFTALYSFTATSTGYGDGTNSDGALPYADLLLSGNTLYGTAVGGGSSGNGTVFAVNTDGTGFTNLHNFTAPSDSYPDPSTNSDGAGPRCGLILSGNTLYGTANAGGSGGAGTVFAVNTDGTGFTNLHSFTALLPYPGPYTNSDGANPRAGLLLSGNTLYGTASDGGASGHGTLFAVNTDGTGFTVLHSFTETPPYPGPYTNSDGANPRAGLLLSGNTLYGTAAGGGSGGAGTVFALSTNGTGFTALHSFTPLPTCPYCPPTNSDGVQPNAGLILSGNILYGATIRGGSGGGTIFALNTNGTGFRTLRSPGSEVGLISNPAGNTLYGTAVDGGSSGNGTVFAVNTDGTGFTNLHNFTATFGSSYPYTNSDGAGPQAGLIISGGTLYGTAANGGSAGNGTVFSLSFRPQLTIIRSGTNVILSWPTNAAGFDYTGFTLQSTTNLVSLAVWSSNSPAPVVVNGLNTVTNPISDTQTLFRLKSL